MPKHCICMVSDFFYPNMGGVEWHIFQLSQCLLELGHKVIVVTHFYEGRVGIRYLNKKLKVYYLPFLPFYNKSILPTIVCSIPRLRNIFLSEGVSLVHSHSAFSSLANEALFVASLLDIPSVFTDHSLFGFSDASAIITNTFLKYSLANTSHAICVSHTGKENTVLRSGVGISHVSVIPNAVDSAVFRPPEVAAKPKDRVTVVLGSRLVYRKGIDLVAQILPVICRKRFQRGNQMGIQVDFVIAGDGPKRIVLEEAIEKNKLQKRVVMLGELNNLEVRDKLLMRGDVFLNTSLTEAFCMAIVEAVSCGLTVVSTSVGGIPEVLPEEFIYFVQPDPEDILRGLTTAIDDFLAGKRPSPERCNQFVRDAYSWKDVAIRTEKIYKSSTARQSPSLGKKVRRLWEKGSMAGPLMAMLYLFCHYFILILSYIQPIHMVRTKGVG